MINFLNRNQAGLIFNVLSNEAIDAQILESLDSKQLARKQRFDVRE